jgi:hypothetical protein
MKISSALRKFMMVGACSLLTPFALFAASNGEIAMSSPEVQTAMAAQESVTPALMQQAGILGTAVGINDDGTTNVTVYVDRETQNVTDVINSVPKQIGSVNVKVDVTDKFRSAIGSVEANAVTGTPHTAKQTPPIQLGTSGGWSKDLANGFCCGGTIGALVSIGGVPHVLSNYHVFEADIVPGGNGIVAMTGDPIIQPGLIDVNCNAAGAQTVATLVKKSSLPGSNVDCSVAQVVPGMVDPKGRILEVGAISKTTLPAALRQKVKKSGRTTGLTASVVSGLNATISVTYDNECAGGVAFTKTYTGQIVVRSSVSNPFISGGDSGSLMVENKNKFPRPIGLLYASSSTTAIAQPIDEVLAFLGATMVGK